MRCAACDCSLTDIDARARNDVGEFYELCGTCRFFVKTYWSTPVNDDKDTEVWYTPEDDRYDTEDIHGMHRAFRQAERDEERDMFG